MKKFTEKVKEKIIAVLVILFMVFTAINAHATILNYPQGGTNTSSTPIKGGVVVGNGSAQSYLATSTNGYGLIQSSTAPSGVAWSPITPAAAAQIIASGAVTSTINGNGSSSVISYFNYSYYLPVPSLLALNGCFGSSTLVDAGGCINYIYSIAPGSSQLYIPPFSYSYSTDIKINTAAKKMNIIGAGGGGFFSPGASSLQYNGTGTAYAYNVQQYSSEGIGLYFVDLVGPAGFYAGGTTGIGSSTTLSNTTGTLGVFLGGTNGATGFNLFGDNIQGFARGVQIGDNAFITNIQNTSIQHNGMAIYEPNNSNSNENNKITDSLIADCNYGTGSTAQNCVYLTNSQSDTWTVKGTDFDDAQINLAETGVNNVTLNLAGGNYFENPSPTVGCYAFVTGAPGNASNTNIYSAGNTYIFNDISGDCPEMVNNGGNFITSGDTIASYSDHATTTITFVNNQDSNDAVNWFGTNATWMTNSQQNTYIYGTNPISFQGLGQGSSAPVYNITLANTTIANALSITGAATFSGSAPTLTGTYTSTSQFAGASLTLRGPSSLGAYGGTQITQQNVSPSGATDGGLSINQVSATGTYIGTVMSTDYQGGVLSISEPTVKITGNTLTDNNGVKYSTSTANTNSTGTTNYVPYFTGATSLGTSSLYYQSSTGNIGINTTNPGNQLDINGGYTAINGISSMADMTINSNTIQTFGMQNQSTGTSAEFRFIVQDSAGQYLAFGVPSINNNAQLFGANRSSSDYIFNNSGAGVARNLTIGTIAASSSLIFGTGNITRATMSSSSFILGQGGNNVGFATSGVSVSACGTGSPTITGSNNVGALVTGTSASSCKVTFAAPTFNTAPVCVVSDSNTSAVTDVSAVSSSSVTFSLASALSAVSMYYQCYGNPN